MMKTIRVGTRGSRLAIAQTGIALAALRKVHPEIRFEVTKISTKGDVDKRPLFTMDEKGIFEKEVNEAVKQGEVDFAVHSLKDIPPDLSDDLSVACIPKRGSPNDVLVTDNGQKLKDLLPGSVIGTSSLRRAVQLTRARPGSHSHCVQEQSAGACWHASAGGGSPLAHSGGCRKSTFKKGGGGLQVSTRSRGNNQR